MTTLEEDYDDLPPPPLAPVKSWRALLEENTSLRAQNAQLRAALEHPLQVSHNPEAAELKALALTLPKI